MKKQNQLKKGENKMKMNKKAVAGIGLGALALVGGTFAYYNQTASLDNPLKTGHYENEVVEDYTPPTDEVKPGATIDKKVGARNTGDYPVVVRIRMDEKWQRANAEGVVEELVTDYTAQSSNSYLSSFNIQDKTDEGLWKATQANDTDGYTEGDFTVIRKNLAEGSENKWLYNQRDGYWYYYKVLEKGEATEIDLLDSLSIASNIDLGYYDKTDWYYIGSADTVKEEIEDWEEYTINRDDDGKVTSMEVDGTTIEDLNGDGIVDAIDLAWYFEKVAKTLGKDQKLFRRNESKLDETRKGYADANYTLVITSQFVQATPDAVKEAFTDAENGAIYDTYWFDLVFDGYDLNTNAGTETEAPETEAPETEATEPEAPVEP